MLVACWVGLSLFEILKEQGPLNPVPDLLVRSTAFSSTPVLILVVHCRILDSLTFVVEFLYFITINILLLIRFWQWRSRVQASPYWPNQHRCKENQDPRRFSGEYAISFYIYISYLYKLMLILPNCYRSHFLRMSTGRNLAFSSLSGLHSLLYRSLRLVL